MTAQQYVVVGTAADTTIRVTRSHAATSPPQGLVLDADHPLTIGRIEATRIVIWADTAPDTTAVTTTCAGDLRVWNVWRDGDLIQAWEGEARLSVDDDGDDLGLSCHDGHGDPEPSLVVRLGFDRAWTQPAGG